MNARLFFQVCSMEARKSMSYRADFWINAVVTFAADFGVVYFLWQAMYRESGRTVMGGYSLNAIIMYSIAVVLFGKIVRGPELEGHISHDIYEGGLNRYLVFPSSYLFFKYAQRLGAMVPAFVQVALFGTVTVFVFISDSQVAVSVPSVVMSVIALACANVMYYLLSFPIQAVAFWADNVWSLMVLLRFAAGLLGGLLLPLTLFPDWARSVLDYLPFRFLYFFPVETLLGRVSLEDWARGMVLAFAWCIAIAVVGKMIWKRGDLRYTGIGI